MQEQHPDNEAAYSGPERRRPVIVKADADDQKAATGKRGNRSDPDHRKSLRRSWMASSPVTKLTVVFTGVIALATVLYCIFSGWQLYEIHSGSADTHVLAEAAKKQAEKAETISAAIQQAATAMDTSNTQVKDASTKTIGQSKSGLDAAIAASRIDERAWVAQVAIVLDAPEIGKAMHGYVTWSNSGKTFAKKVQPAVHLVFLSDRVESESNLITPEPNTIAENSTSIGVLAPNAQYKTMLDTKKPAEEIDKTRIGGTWYTYIWGEIIYYDIFKRRHTTSFCSLRQGPTADFIQCPFHNDAD